MDHACGDIGNEGEFVQKSIDKTSKLRCVSPNIEDERFQDEDFETATSIEQVEIEASIHRCYQTIKNKLELDPEGPTLHREPFFYFLRKGLRQLPNSYEVLDASRPWLCYWIIHSMELLQEDLPEETKTEVIDFLKNCQHPDGGFGGGPGQDAHLAPTYSAVNALCMLKSQEAYDVIDREKLLDFLFRMKRSDGSFSMHEDSECDLRGVYCALSVAMLTSVWCDNLIKKTAHWISRCQTYEGGFGGVPDMEAHGGYTFCGLASLVLLKEGKLINIHRLLRWLVNRQMRYEGGFQGRTNKLVDSCYSFWQGGCFPLLHRLLEKSIPEILDMDTWLFDQKALQEYLLVCCQAPHGGLVDKPGKSEDYYHTCYALSGLCVAQHFHNRLKAVDCFVGPVQNELQLHIHPIYNICVPSAIQAIQYFNGLPFPPMPAAAQNDASNDETES